VTTEALGLPEAVRVKTYGDLIGEYATHPEAKSSGSDGRVCRISTVGALGRVRVQATRVQHIGKESNALEEVVAGEVRLIEDPTLTYTDERGDWEAALPALRRLRDEHGWKHLATASGLSERAVRYALNGGKLPHRAARTALLTCIQLNRSPSAQPSSRTADNQPKG